MFGQSDPLFVPTSSLMKSSTLSTDDLAQEDLLQKYQERLERLSQQNRVIKFCIDAGFLTTVDVRQYFMTKHTDKFLTDPKGWIRGEHQNWARGGSHNLLLTM